VAVKPPVLQSLPRYEDTFKELCHDFARGNLQKLIIGKRMKAGEWIRNQFFCLYSFAFILLPVFPTHTY